MKTLYTLLLITVGFSAVAQSSFVGKHITNDGHQLRIRVDIEEHGRSIHYNRSFDVSDMEKITVKALENRIIDSLEQQAVQTNAVGVAQVGHKIKTQEEQVGRGVHQEFGTDENRHLEASATPSLSPDDVMPSSVLVREDKENGRLWMQYVFQKDGNELIVERTANVIGKSEREKQAIIRDTERSFGIKTGHQ